MKRYKVCSACQGTRRIKWQSLPAGAKDPRDGQERTCCACVGGYETAQHPSMNPQSPK